MQFPKTFCDNFSPYFSSLRFKSIVMALQTTSVNELLYPLFCALFYFLSIFYSLLSNYNTVHSNRSTNSFCLFFDVYFFFRLLASLFIFRYTCFFNIEYSIFRAFLSLNVYIAYHLLYLFFIQYLTSQDHLYHLFVILLISRFRKYLSFSVFRFSVLCYVLYL